MARKPTPGPSSQIKIATTPEKAAAGGPITSERIAADLAAFRAGGGRIEVLGNTRVLSPSEMALLPKVTVAPQKTPARKAK
jgi:hypothetical protein